MMRACHFCNKQVLVVVMSVSSLGHARMFRTDLARQDLSCTYLACHELESIFIFNIIIVIITVLPSATCQEV